MTLPESFRRSFYGTLGSACLALGYAEHPVLPESAIVAAAAVLGLLALYFWEQYLAALSIPAANRLGLLVGLAALLWTSWRVGQEWFDPQLLQMDWSSLLTALLGPLVMVLMPVKLLRRDKHIGDYWWLHGLALAAATLAAAMVQDLLGFVLLAAYIVLALRHWQLLHAARSAGWIAPLPGPPTLSLRPLSAQPLRLIGWSQVALPLATAVLLIGPLYLLTPPSPASPSRFGQPRIEVGYAADQMVNLTYTGTLEPNRTPLFEVEAVHTDGTPASVASDQRWRGRELRRYERGRWEAGDIRLPTILPAVRNRIPWQAPQFGPRQLILTFRPRPDSRALFLADPVYWHPGHPVPIVTLSPQDTEPLPWQWLGDGTFFIDLIEAESWPYQQYWHPPEPADLSPPFVIVDPDRDRLLRALTYNPLPRLQEFADGLVQQWHRNSELPADLIDPALQRPRRRYHERLARLFCHYLRYQAGLRYTTELRLVRTDIDPIEDFLFHSKAGHCERFATALVLLLRTQGIPAQLVLGCKGCEPLDQPGRYMVRHEHAHAWVECLIEEYEAPPRFGLRPISRWLTLDPTPDDNQVTTENYASWIRQGRRELQQWFRNYLLEFTPERRQQALTAVGRIFVSTSPLIIGAAVGVALLVVLRLLVRTRWQASRKRDQPPHPLDELLAVFHPLGLQPQPGETAAAWANRAAAILAARPSLASFADLPVVWVHNYYADRFGGRELTAEHWQPLRLRLQTLRLLLRKQPPITAGTDDS